MAVFEVNDNGRTFQIEAPDQNSAMEAFNRFRQGQSGPSTQQRYDTALDRVRQSQFPGMNDEQWGEYSQRAFAPSLQAQSQQTPTLGFSDEISAAMGGIGAQLRQWTGGGGGGFGEAYGDLYELEQARLELAREQNGGLGFATEIATGLGAPAAVSAAATQAPRLLAQQPSTMFGRAANAVIPPAVAGATYGFGSTNGDLGQRAWGAGLGGAIGLGGAAAVPLVGRLVGSATTGIRNRATRASNRAGTERAIQSAPSATDIARTSRAAYKEADATGAVIRPEAMNIFRHDVDGQLQALGIRLPNGELASSFPRVTDAVRAIDAFTAGPVAIPQAHTLLRTLRRVQKSTDPAEARIGNLLVHQFEDFMDNLPRGAFSAGDGPKVIQAWARGRNEWARSKRTQAIEDIINDARLRGGDFASGLRSGFSSMLRAKNAKRRRGFTPSELRAIERFVEGGPMDELFRRLGGGSGLAAFGFGGMGGGLTGAIAAPALGALARGHTNRQARSAADAIRAQVALPGGLPAPLPTIPTPRPTGLPLSGGIGANVGANDPAQGTRRYLTR